MQATQVVPKAKRSSKPSKATKKAAVTQAPSIPIPEKPQPSVELLDLNCIVNSTYNPRKDFREETLQELSDSILQVGVLQPICVRPKGEGFEIVYGERRYWAAAMANLSHIPAIVRELSDAEAEDAAITENLQREDVKPREEAAAYKRALESGRHSIESLVGKFGKSEAYVRSRLKLCELIDSLSEQLDREEISVGVATEIAKYDADVQQEVYDEHFSEDCRMPWKNARIKEIASRLYERYMTKLESYLFDKHECSTCMHNTANQVLFSDCGGSCAGCQNRSCMIRKNEEFLVQKVVKLLQDDPRIRLASDANASVDAVIEALDAQGYQVEILPFGLWNYDKEPKKPTEPTLADFNSQEEFAEAQDEYMADLTCYAEEVQEIDTGVSAGTMRKYAVIRNLDVEIRYEQVEAEEQEITVDDGRRLIVTTIPDSPMDTLLQQDRRNRELCYEHITADLKRLLYQEPVSREPLRDEEAQMFRYAVMCAVDDTRLRQLGIETKEQYLITRDERFKASSQISEEQSAALMRAFLLVYFGRISEDRCTDETLDTRLLCRFADLNFAEKSLAVQQEYLQTYEKRKARLQEQIDALTAQRESAAREASVHQEPDTEPQTIPEMMPDESPFIDDPQPIVEPLSIPVDPEIELETQALQTAA